MKLTLLTACLATLASAPFLSAAPLTEASVTTVVNDVRVLTPGKGAKKAAVRDVVRKENAVRTGGSSRAELTFTDNTLLRLGANSLFSFEEGSREVGLEEGTLLFQVPKGTGGATLKTAAVSAAITGTTGLMNFTRPTRKALGAIKLILLEGSAKIAGRKVKAGQMFFAFVDRDMKLVQSQVVNVDTEKVVSTSLLTGGSFRPLASAGLIAKTIAGQQKAVAASLAQSRGESGHAIDTMHDRRPRTGTREVPPPVVVAAPAPRPVKERPRPPVVNTTPVDPVDPICREIPQYPGCPDYPYNEGGTGTTGG